MVFYIVHMPIYCKTFQNDLLLDSASAMLFMQNIFVFTFDMGHLLQNQIPKYIFWEMNN